VLDASVLVKWFRPEGEQYVDEAVALQRLYESGALLVTVPPLLYLEMLNSASRRWHWDAARLNNLADVLVGFAFRSQQPAVRAVARWAIAGLTAYDACYVALAEELSTFVVTADDLMLRLGGDRARSLAGVAAEFGA